MRNLVIFHPRTGRAFPLTDGAFIFDPALLPDPSVLDKVMSNAEAYAIGGMPMDNYNMGNFFYGDDV